ncbi:uncharacterized protein AB675_5024 [Cyphellophora attinorum]|uniref:Pentatricopeptide repeat domain-containing protein n=1 Tax=Cyphellophora attinorum TaxID=1664694 RepID=A0A0N1H370_9EURO|nr:uncharacterized protein AB675_5024 [Phialophora attinorum]KPI39226.1 hypothetical protein AB675_5024 [Phialophora attinorum]
MDFVQRIRFKPLGGDVAQSEPISISPRANHPATVQSTADDHATPLSTALDEVSESSNQDRGAPRENCLETADQYHDTPRTEGLGPEAVSIAERRLLARARLHGIYSADRLDYEIDLGRRAAPGLRMLDGGQATRNDLDLWLFLIDAARQKKGVQGIHDLSNALFHRGPPLQLTSDNGNARDMIDAFLWAAINGPKAERQDYSYLKRICTQCRNRGYCADLLFVGTVGGLLRMKPHLALSMAQWLRNRQFYKGPDDLQHIFRSACASAIPSALEHCNDVLNLLTSDKVYHWTVPYLWETERAADAFAWHDYRLAHGDRPQNFSLLLPDIEPFITNLTKHGVDFAGQVRQTYEIMATDLANKPTTVNGAVSRAVAAARRFATPSDETVARLFATASLSFDFALNSLCFLGLRQIGPMSVRQMILGAPDLTTVNERFELLQQRGVDMGAHPFVVVIRQLHKMKEFGLLKRIAETDMHHDEFSDMTLQRSLLRRSVPNKEIFDTTRSLLILRASDNRLQDSDWITNTLLVDAIHWADWQRVLEIVVSLHQTRHVITPSVITYLSQRCLGPSVRREMASEFLVTPREADLVSFSIGICQQILSSGSNIDVSFWRYAFVALAHTSRISEVHRLIRWILRHYGPGGQLRARSASSADLKNLFTPMTQKAIIAWDFTKVEWKRVLFGDRAPPDHLFFRPLTSPPWIQTARLLRYLSDHPDLGVEIDYMDLEDEFVYRLRQMHRTVRSTQISSNRRWAAVRGFTLLDMAEHWLKVWEGSGHSVDGERMLKKIGKLITTSSYPQERWPGLRRVMNRRVNPHVRTYLDDVLTWKAHIVLRRSLVASKPAAIATASRSEPERSSLFGLRARRNQGSDSTRNSDYQGVQLKRKDTNLPARKGPNNEIMFSVD